MTVSKRLSERARKSESVRESERVSVSKRARVRERETKRGERLREKLQKMREMLVRE